MNRGALLKVVEKRFTRSDIPAFKPGDTVRVNYKVVEGTRSRVQAYEGMVIKIKRNGFNSSFTVRKISFGEGVERIFPFNSPLIDSVSVVNFGRVRRAKLYYLRELKGKAARIRADRGRMMKGLDAEREEAAEAAGADQLTKIEGIGPKIASALVAAGLETFAKLAAATEDQLKRALEASKVRGSASLSTWPKQAEFLAKGDEEGFQAYLATLAAGRE